MSANKIAQGIQNVFSVATRERCMTKLKQTTAAQWGSAAASERCVLVPLCRVDNVPSLLYCVRRGQAARGGDVSFPGGRVAPHESPVAAALARAERDIGLHRSKVDVWGAAARVGRVAPVVGAVNQLVAGDLRVDAAAVQEVFAVPLEALVDPRSHFHTRFRAGFLLPVFVAERVRIWGDTALVTHAFLSAALGPDIYSNDWMNSRLLFDR